MAPSKSSNGRPATSSNDTSRDRRAKSEGPGLWRVFPIVTVVIGVIVGIIWSPPDRDTAETTPVEPTGESSAMQTKRCVACSISRVLANLFRKISHVQELLHMAPQRVRLRAFELSVACQGCFVRLVEWKIVRRS